MKRQLFPAALALGATLCLPHATLADNQYQFSLSPHYLVGNSPVEADVYGLNVTGYLKPVTLDGKTPWAITPFYSRHAALSLSETRAKYTDLSVIRSGRVIKKEEFKNRSVSTIITDTTLPVWVGAAFNLPDYVHYEFSAGTDLEIEPENTQRYDLGWYITENIGIYAFSERADIEGYGAGFRSLIRSASSSFMELSGEYYRGESEVKNLTIVGNTIRNEFMESIGQESWNIQMSLYPAVNFGMKIGFGKTEDSDGVESKIRYLGLNYYVTANLDFGLTYQNESQSEHAWAYGYRPIDGVSATLGLRF